MACAGFYGIRQTYTVLAHLRWAIKPENATVTAMCLEILCNELKPLKQAEAEGALLPQVTTSAASATCCLITRLFCRKVTGNHALLTSSLGLLLACLTITSRHTVCEDLLRAQECHHFIGPQCLVISKPAKCAHHCLGVVELKISFVAECRKWQFCPGWRMQQRHC